MTPQRRSTTCLMPVRGSGRYVRRSRRSATTTSSRGTPSTETGCLSPSSTGMAQLRVHAHGIWRTPPAFIPLTDPDDAFNSAKAAWSGVPTNFTHRAARLRSLLDGYGMVLDQSFLELVVERLLVKRRHIQALVGRLTQTSPFAENEF